MARTLPEANPFSANLLPVWGKGISPGFSELGSTGSPCGEFLGEGGCCSSSWWLVPNRQPGLQVRVLASSVLTLAAGSSGISLSHLLP